ncbi:hypothetical protein JRQ81_010324 [Phrynocephalus forsythii]|uniref:Integrator complex subunit 1 n=1 Tax=Phrynocephalus forsythii TaxID=171643 RepID=A0A9Q0X8Q4_9SAUR|nr:hypothetical protein JRQ81_010324 [Phrynocephalus forsythii]
MNRPKPAAARRPSALVKPSGHPPPGDFIALGLKGQASESKASATLLKPASAGLPSERKREASAALAGCSGLTGLSKRPKLASTPPLSALGRLAEAAVAEKRAISPSIKEPSVIPIEVAPTVLLDEIESAEAEGNDDRIEGVLCGAVKQLKMNRAKPDTTLYLSLMYLAKIKPNIFATEGVIEALCSLLRRDSSINFKAKGNSLVSVLTCNLLMAAYEEDENWPEIFVKVYIEDSLGERVWVDSPHCKTFVENVQTAFSTKMPPKNILSHMEVGRGGGDLSAGNSPHPSVPDEEDSQSELLIAEDKMSPEEEGQLMARYDDLAESVEEYVLDILRDQLNRRQPMDNVSRNLLRLLTATCGYKEIRQLAVQRLEMWLQNPKLTRPAQDLLMSVCMNCNTHGSEDVEVVSNLIKIRLKPKVLLNHYMLCVRSLLNAHRDNLGTVVKSVIFNELSNARNPNNMQILYTVLQHSPELAPKFLAMVFQDLLTNKDDYLRASRALLREIIKQTKHEINFQAFCLGLMQERKEPQYNEMEFKDRFVIHITDLLAVSMMLSITAQVKEAGIAWDKGEKKNLEVLRSFQNQIAAIQRDAVWWLHTVVPSITKLAPKDYVHCLHKVLFTEQPETYYKWDNWPPESDRNFFLRLCSEVPILEDTLMRILVIGLSRDLPLGPADAMELADHLHERGATGGQTFHSLLTASLPSRRDSDDVPRVKTSLETPQGQGRIRALAQIQVLSPKDDLAALLLQLFPLTPDPRWQNSNPRALALALQQSLGKELAQARQGKAPVPAGMAMKLLQALAALLNAPRGGTMAVAMHRNHVVSCPLLRLLSQYQRCVPQDAAFSSLFFKVLMQMLQWLENPAVEDGPLRSQLKALALQYSSRHRIRDVRGGFLHLAEALSFRRDAEVIGSTVCALIATLKSGENCNVEPEVVSKVLQGLTETHSPYLEELLVALFSVTVETSSRFPATGPVSMVSSLLLQQKEETPVKKETESASAEAAGLGPSSGLFIDWLETLDPEVIKSCPDLQQRLLFSWNKDPSASQAEPPSFRPYLLALLTHQSSWTTLHRCIATLLSRSREPRFDPTASLDFLWACIHIPRIWQGRDQRIPQVNGLLSCCRSKGTPHTGTTGPSEESCQSRFQISPCNCHVCNDLLLQIYLQLPDLLLPVPEALLSIEGAKDSSSPCKLDGLVHRFITLLADSGNSKSCENRLWDANMACRKLAVTHPILLLRHLPMVAALLHGRVHLNFQEFRQQNHLTFFLHVLGILELLQPHVFQSEHQEALWDCLLSFIRLLLSYRKSSRHLAPFISKFVQFIQRYITSNAPAAIAFLQKHSDPLHDLSSDNSDLAVLKSLLAGLSLPSKNGALDRGAEDEKDGEPWRRVGHSDLVIITVLSPLLIFLDILEVLTDIDEMSRRRPEVLAFFSTHLQRFMSSSEETCRNLAFSLALRSIQNNPSIASGFLPTFMYCLGSRDFEVVQTALRNLPEYTLLCQEHAAGLLQRAFLVGMYGQTDTSSQISETLKILHMEAMI